MANKEKIAKSLQGHLEPGEQVLVVIKGTYEGKFMGSDINKGGSFCATNKRVIFFAKKIFGYDMEVFPYSNISSIEVSKGLMGHTISLFASGNGSKMKWVRDKEVDDFVRVVRENIGKKHDFASDGNNAMDQIKKLSELHEQGILSREEFESKKKDLLSKI